MTKPVSVNHYKAAQRAVRDAAADVAAKRTAGLALIAARGGNTIAREDACGAYLEARFWLKTYRERLAAVHQAALEKIVLDLHRQLRSIKNG